MDLRGSGSSFGSGSRVSAMPPVPMCFLSSSSAFCTDNDVSSIVDVESDVRSSSQLQRIQEK